MNLNEFLAMGGYGLYVWSSYAAAALVLVFNILSARRRMKAVRQHLAEQIRLQRDTDE